MHFPFCSIEILDSFANFASLFDSKRFIMFLVGLFMMTVGRKHIYLVDLFIACINTYLHAKFKK